MNQKLIKDLKEGKIAVYFNKEKDLLVDLKRVLDYAFPEDYASVRGINTYYYRNALYKETWDCLNQGCAIKSVPLAEFLNENKTFPRKMLVWDYDGEEKLERIVLAELPGNPIYRYITALVWHEERFNSGKEYYISQYKYAEELPEENPQKQVLLDKADELIRKAEELKKEANKL
jgi:hypothetical protein